MKRVVLTLAMLAAGAASAQAQTWYHYECTDGARFEVGFYPETRAAFLRFDGRSMQLPKALLADQPALLERWHGVPDEEGRPGDDQARRQDVGGLSGEVARPAVADVLVATTQKTLPYSARVTEIMERSGRR